MSVISKDELFSKLQTLIGEDVSDEALTLVEDFTDTINEMSNQIEESGNWKQKFEENDASWKKKYIERFFTTPEEVKEEQEENVKEEDSEISDFDDLFEEREG